MAKSVIVDAGFLVALMSRRDAHHPWALAQAERYPPPWQSCESVLSEAFHLLGPGGRPALAALLQRQALRLEFELGAELKRVLALLEKYADVPMSLADSCLVRMTEIRAEPVLLTTDSGFTVYRRHGRQTIPCEKPS